MYKQYLKQAWNLLRQERVFSLIYIVGTGLSITMVMVLSIVFYLKMANIYPETKRDRMLVVKSAKMVYGEGRQLSTSGISMNAVHLLFDDIEGIEAIALNLTSVDLSDYRVQLPGVSKEQYPVKLKAVNEAFWSVYSFRFLSGKPFTEADEQSALPVAVVSESLARRLFGEEEAVGREMMLNLRAYRIVGVVQDVSPVTELSYASVWIPGTMIPGYEGGDWDPKQMLGRLQVVLLAREGADQEAIRSEVAARVSRLNASWEEGTSFSLKGQPDRFRWSVFRSAGSLNVDFGKTGVQYALLFLILLLVPAVSLSGMADSRMERRIAEMGVRRAFGAPSSTLFGQVVTENLLFTLLGGLVGLLMSYLLVYLTRGWIMQLVGGGGFVDLLPEGTDVTLSLSMLLNPVVFAVALGVCFVLNLLSALIPAWKAARRAIIHSLNEQ